MSVPRFKYRLQFKDERRPSPAFLYAIVSHLLDLVLILACKQVSYA